MPAALARSYTDRFMMHASPQGPRPRRFGRASVLTLCLVDCAVISPADDAPPAAEEVPFVFPHYIHVEEQGFPCSLCHTKYEESDEPGMPARETCMLCHVEMDRVKPADRQVADLFVGAEFQAQHNVLLPGERIFSHKLHATSGLLCNECHLDIEHNESVQDLPKILMADCMACHTDFDVPTDCSTCHQQIRKEIKTADHNESWGLPQKQHCNGCHFPLESDQQYCQMCHQETVSHNTLATAMPNNHALEWNCRSCHSTGMLLSHPDPGHDCTICHNG